MKPTAFTSPEGKQPAFSALQVEVNLPRVLCFFSPLSLFPSYFLNSPTACRSIASHFSPPLLPQPPSGFKNPHFGAIFSFCRLPSHFHPLSPRHNHLLFLAPCQKSHSTCNLILPYRKSSLPQVHLNFTDDSLLKMSAPGNSASDGNNENNGSIPHVVSPFFIHI